MKAMIIGSTMPVLEIGLDDGEAIFAESGQLSWMSSQIQMETRTGLGGGGGFLGTIKRLAGGGTLFMTQYLAQGGEGHVAFAAKVPGHILQMEIGPGREMMLHRHGFVCGTPQIEISVALQRSLGAGLFGGDGFLLQKVAGRGVAWIELSGELVRKQLAPGETLRVHPGHVGAFDARVSFEITTVPGIKNKVFGGDGIFLASLTGPGEVWLQTLPIPILAGQIAEYIGGGEPTVAGAAGGLLGGALKELL